MGVPQEQIVAAREHRAAPPKPTLALWAWHQRPFKVFKALRRQVRTRGPVVLGLDLAVLPVVERRLVGTELDAAELQALDTMSDELAELMNAPLQEGADG